MPTPTAQPSRPIDFVLHIGSCKTGSASIQYFLSNNREQLADLGCLWPLRATRRHDQLGLSIKSDADLEASPKWKRKRWSDPATFRKNFRHRLIQEIDQSGLPRVLLSDESLYHEPDVPALRRLRRLTDEVATNLRLVVYLRRQDDHVISRYQQRVRNGAEMRRMDEFVRQDASMPYDYAARLHAWEDLLEPDEFVVRRFEKESFVDGSLVQDFLHAADVDLEVEDLEQIPRYNDSLDAERVEFLRLFNLYRVESEGYTPSWSDNRDLVARLRETSTGPLLTLPGHVLDDFMAQWEEGNGVVAKRYLGDPSGELFRMPRRTHNTTTEQLFDPARLDHYLALLELPERMHKPLRRLVEREAKATDALYRRAGPRSRIRSLAIAGTARLLRSGRDSAAKARAT